MLKLKLGLTRNRLFEPSNVVLFSGKYKEPLLENEVNKSLKMLGAKYEIITSLVEFTEGDDAFLLTERVCPKAEFSSLNFSQFKKCIPASVDFTKALFGFFVTADNYLVIVSHTLVADGKALLRLAKAFSEFYSKKSLSVEPEKIEIFSDFQKLPVEVGSPFTDKLAANLDEKWNKKPLNCNLNDCKRLIEQYGVNRDEIGYAKSVVSAEQMKKVTAFCEENNLDVSALFAFCVYECLRENFKGDKKEDKLVVSSDRRFFFNNPNDYTVGAFDGTIEISFNKNMKNKARYLRLKDFQRDFYKAMTSVFRGFYDDVLLMKLIPQSCDAAYLYALGFNKNKGARNLAENYTCLNRKLCRYSFFNLEQSFWDELKSFSDIECFDALRLQFNGCASVVLSDGEGRVFLKYRSERIAHEKAKKSLEKAVEMLFDIVSEA